MVCDVCVHVYIQIVVFGTEASPVSVLTGDQWAGMTCHPSVSVLPLLLPHWGWVGSPHFVWIENGGQKETRRLLLPVLLERKRCSELRV